MLRTYLALVESGAPRKHPDRRGRLLWIACSPLDAQRLMTQGPDLDDRFADAPADAVERLDDAARLSGNLRGSGNADAGRSEGGTVVLEFKVRAGKAAEDALRHAPDGIAVHDPEAVRFHRVWSGVVDDPFADQARDGELDEVALGGLRRCTAVTCDALLKHFGKPGLTLSQVPETDVGVLGILTRGGLAYRPAAGAAGRTLQQFAALNGRGAWYLVTPGHALALVEGELFDAENRGADGRKIIEAFAITRR